MNNAIEKNVAQREIEDIPMEHRTRYAQLAVEMIGMCLTDIGMVLQQGVRDDNQGKLGGIVSGLHKAAMYLDGKRHVA